MWQIRRLLLDHIGPPSARFLEVRIDCANPGGRPLDTILWLRNGGGKSTLMGLLGAVLRPRRTDFLASSQTDKHLEDYVLGGDCAHVVIEWADETGRRLLTGGAYEWMDQIRPPDPSRDHDRLNQRWWLLVPGAGTELEDLPLTRGGRRLRQDEFLAAVRELHALTEVVIARNQEEWRRSLDDRGIDPDLFGVIVAMNQTEGGIETQFQFSNTDQFVRRILELVIAPEEPAQIAHIIEQVAGELADRPAMIAERAFTGEAVPRLEELANAVATHREAEHSLQEATSSAATLRSAIRLAVSVWQSRAEASEAFRSAAGQRAREEKSAADRWAGERDELRRLAALMRHDTAERRLETARTAADEREVAAKAWAAVPALQRLEASRVRVASLQAQADADRAGAEPFRLDRERAGGRYAAALEQLIVELERLASEAEQGVDTEQERAAAARDARDAIRDERSSARSRIDLANKVIAEVEEQVGAARRAGLLEPDEAVSAALDRIGVAQDERSTRQESLASRRREIADELASFDAREAERGQREGDLRQERGVLGAELDGLRAEISALAGEARLALLGEEDEPDPLRSGRALLTALGEQAATAEKRLLELGVAGAEDERAVASMSDGGLYPPSIDLVESMAALKAAGIAADYGWSYLADSVAADRRLAVLARQPAISGGIVLHHADDLERASATVREAGLTPASLVVLGLTADLHAASGDGNGEQPPYIVVPPRAAIFDRNAAQAELVRRDVDRRRRAEESDLLRSQRDGDRRLADRLDTLLERSSPESLSQLEVQVTALDEALRSSEREREADAARRAELRDETAAIDSEQSEITAQLRELTEAHEQLTVLRERDGQRAAAVADIEAAEQELASLRLQEVKLADEEGEATAAANRHRQRAQRYRTQLAVQRNARDQVEVPAVDAAEDDNVERLRQQWQEADRAWRAALGQSAALAALQEAESTLRDARRVVDLLPPEVCDLAGRLVATPDASSDAAQADALAEAERDFAAAQRAVGKAEAELSDSREQVEQTRAPADRQRHGRLEREPANEDEARQMADHAEAERGAAQQRSSDAELEERDQRRAAGEAETRAGQFDLIAQLLAAAAVDDVETEPFPSEVQDAKAAAEAAATRLTEAQTALEAAAERLRRVGSSLVVWAADERFATVKPDVRGRFMRENFVEEEREHLEELITELRTYHSNVSGRLSEIEAHKDLAVDAMTSAARRAVDELRRLERLSELPASLRTHPGERFLQLGPKSMPSDHSVQRDRVSRTLNAILEAERTELRGMEVLWRAVKALVGEGGFRAKLLKPTPSDHIERVAPEGMRKWSGGERVTMAVLLDCAVFKLRARNRGREVPGIGVLPLDNPLGKASHIAFLDLQRQVAAAVGVQLIYLTAVGDMRAVGRFPNVVRMANRPHKGREYVHVTGRDLADSSDEGRLSAAAVQRRLDEVVPS